MARDNVKERKRVLNRMNSKQNSSNIEEYKRQQKEEFG